MIFSNEAMIKENNGFHNKLEECVNLVNLAERDSRIKVKIKITNLSLPDEKEDCNFRLNILGLNKNKVFKIFGKN